MSAMLGVVADWQASEWIGELVAVPHFVSLHTSTPLIGDPTASEPPGASYQRAQCSFLRSSARAMASNVALRWTGLPSLTVTHLGIFADPTGSKLRAAITLSAPVVVLEGGGYSLAKGELYWRFP